ncbi:MAG: RNA polymerase sigma factor [Pseudomonadota bacterium]
MGKEANIASHKTVEALYATCFRQLVAFLRSRFGSGPPPPEDLAQSAFERLLTARELREDASPKAFLWRTATNLAISSHRKNGVEQRNLPQFAVLFTDSEGCHRTPERVTEAEEQLDKIYKVLTQMPEKRSSAFLLVRVDGLSHAEAAAILGVSRAAVSKHVAKATKEIAGLLGYAEF